MLGGGDLGALLNAYGSDEDTLQSQEGDEIMAGGDSHKLNAPSDRDQAQLPLPASPAKDENTLELPDTTKNAQVTQNKLEESLPPELKRPPGGECDPELEARVAKWIHIQRQGPRLIDQLRGSREYRNPEFFRKMIERWEIDEHGSCFDPKVFDPKSLPEEDTLTALESEWAKEEERRRNKRTTPGKERIEFVKAQATAAHIAAAQAKAAALAASFKRRWQVWLLT